MLSDHELVTSAPKRKRQHKHAFVHTNGKLEFALRIAVPDLTYGREK